MKHLYTKLGHKFGPKRSPAQRAFGPSRSSGLLASSPTATADVTALSLLLLLLATPRTPPCSPAARMAATATCRGRGGRARRRRRRRNGVSSSGAATAALHRLRHGLLQGVLPHRRPRGDAQGKSPYLCISLSLTLRGFGFVLERRVGGNRAYRRMDA